MLVVKSRQGWGCETRRGWLRRWSGARAPWRRAAPLAPRQGGCHSLPEPDLARLPGSLGQQWGEALYVPAVEPRKNEA